jgi:hypothetical protein
MRKIVGLMVLLCVGGLVAAQEKDKGKKDEKVRMIVVKVDAKSMTMTLKPSDKGAEKEYKATTDTKFLGPRGGKREISDEVLKAGAVVHIIADGLTLKEVHLPLRASTKDKEEKEKEKDKKEK